jgi:hypothetical protein
MKIFNCLKTILDLKKKIKELEKENEYLKRNFTFNSFLSLSIDFAAENIKLQKKIKKLEREKRSWMNRALRSNK